MKLYCTYRSSWVGRSTIKRVSLVCSFEIGISHVSHVYLSWNDTTDVESWKLYSGSKVIKQGYAESTYYVSLTGPLRPTFRVNTLGVIDFYVGGQQKFIRTRSARPDNLLSISTTIKPYLFRLIRYKLYLEVAT